MNTRAASSQGYKALAATFGQKYGILMALVLVCVILSFVSEFFLTQRNLTNVLRQASVNGILAIGMTFVILTRGIDLSVGSVAALAGVVSASLATTSTTAGVEGAPYAVAIVLGAGMLAGMAAGWINGVLVAYFNVPAFVTTLGMLSAARGLTLLYSGGRPVASLTPESRFIGTGEILGVPMPIVLFGLVFVLAYLVLSATRFGRHVYAAGGNPHAARVSGINVKRVRMTVYIISGALAGLAGMVLAARTGSALPQAGVAFELDAIAAVVIGGTSLSGGVGRVSGTLLGTLLISVVNNGLDLMGVQSFYQQIVKGMLIVGAVMLDQARHKHA